MRSDTVPPDPPVSRRLARLVRWAILSGMALVGFATMALYFVMPALDAGKPGYMPRAEVGRYLAISSIYWAALVPYGLSLWYVAALLKLVGSGRPLSEAHSLLRRIGGGMVVGAFVTIVARPNLLRMEWIMQGIAALRLRGVGGGFVAADPSAVLLGAVGVALLAAGSMFRRGAAAEAELGQFV